MGRRTAILLLSLCAALLLSRGCGELIPWGFRDNPLAFVTGSTHKIDNYHEFVVSYSGAGNSGAHALWLVKRSAIYGKRLVWTGYVKTDMQEPSFEWLGNRSIAIRCLGTNFAEVEAKGRARHQPEISITVDLD